MAWWKRKKEIKNEKDFSVMLDNASINPFVRPVKESDIKHYRAEEELKRQNTENDKISSNNYLGLFDKPSEENIVKPKSVAKTYGTKYFSDGVQLASSKVVDVRSYKKEEELPSPLLETSKPVVEEEPVKRRSFFDDLLKELEEDNTSSKEEPVEEIKPIVKEEPKPVKPKQKKSSTKRKKNIDIDIISGDFGGSDIL